MKDKIEKIQESIDYISGFDEEPGIIIFNPKTYRQVHKEFGKQGPLIGDHSIFGIPFIVDNIKEDCLILSKDTLEMIKNKLE